jgi:hypothetical protein
MGGKIYGGADPSNSDLTFDMVVPCSFPSRQSIQQAFVSRILDLPPEGEAVYTGLPLEEVRGAMCQEE